MRDELLRLASRQHLSVVKALGSHFSDLAECRPPSAALAHSRRDGERGSSSHEATAIVRT